MEANQSSSIFQSSPHHSWGEKMLHGNPNRTVGEKMLHGNPIGSQSELIHLPILPSSQLELALSPAHLIKPFLACDHMYIFNCHTLYKRHNKYSPVYIFNCIFYRFFLVCTFRIFSLLVSQTRAFFTQKIHILISDKFCSFFDHLDSPDTHNYNCTFIEKISLF
jgi:hypothetical protein